MREHVTLGVLICSSVKWACYVLCQITVPYLTVFYSTFYCHIVGLIIVVSIIFHYLIHRNSSPFVNHKSLSHSFSKESWTLSFTYIINIHFLEILNLTAVLSLTILIQFSFWLYGPSVHMFNSVRIYYLQKSFIIHFLIHDHGWIPY